MDLRTSRNNLLITVFAVFFAVLIVLSVFVGKYPLSIDAIKAGDEMQLKVLFNLRISRTAMAAIGGFVLGISGFVYQTVFRNPLASPDIIGVSSGASAGAAFGILFSGSALLVSVSSFAGAVIAVAAALGLSSIDKSGSKNTIVLSGIAVHALAQTFLMFLKLTADPNRELASIEYWIMGSLSDISGYKTVLNSVICVLCAIVIFALNRQTVLLSSDEGEARTLGIDVGRMRFIILLVATVGVSAVVSVTGLISFIGLLAPHGARLITKDNSKKTLLLCGILGGIILCGADILARSAAKTEIPVSIFTSLIGAPFLIILALKRRHEN